MKILQNFRQWSHTLPVALTIGNFDGVHLGHQSIIQRLREVSPLPTVLTFANHPDEILHRSPVSALTTLPHRFLLLEKFGVEQVILIDFTQEFSQQSAQAFLASLKKRVSFSHLILGHDALIGNDRNNDVSRLGHELDFKVEYLKPVEIDRGIVSSSEIRKCIQRGDLIKASSLLGRPYSIHATVQQGHGNGALLGFHTANLPVDRLALPPYGVYAVNVLYQQTLIPGVANLGCAPTLHDNRPPCLEVHLIEKHLALKGENIEVCFLKYLRPECRFESIDHLKGQIQKDILNAKSSYSRIS